MIAHSPTPTQIALHEARKARQARMSAKAVAEAPQAPANQNKRVRVVMRLPDPLPPRPESEELDMTKMTRRQYARKRAMQFGYTLDQLIQGGAKREFTKVKHRIMYELKTFYPDTSFPMIAELFQLRDHTTVVSAVRKIEDGDIAAGKPRAKRHSSGPSVNRLSDEARDRIVCLWRGGETNKTKIGDQVGVTGMTVLNVLRARGEIE